MCLHINRVSIEFTCATISDGHPSRLNSDAVQFLELGSAIGRDSAICIPAYPIVLWGSRPCPWLALAWGKKMERFRAWSIIGDSLIRESQGEDEGVLEVHAWTKHASEAASGTRLIHRAAHARNRKPRVYVCVCLFRPPFFFSSSSPQREMPGVFHGAGFV